MSGGLRREWVDNIKIDLKNQDVEVWTEFIWLKLRPVMGSCENCNEPSNSIKGGEYID